MKTTMIRALLMAMIVMISIIMIVMMMVIIIIMLLLIKKIPQNYDNHKKIVINHSDRYTQNTHFKEGN